MSSSAPEVNKHCSQVDPRRSGIVDFKAEDLLHISNIQGGRLRSVFKVNFRHVHTVGNLKKVISARHGLSVVTVAYRGVLLADEHKLVHLIPDLQNIGAPRFSVRTRLHTKSKPGCMLVQVSGLNGSTSFVHMSARSTVADLVTAIVDSEAYSSAVDLQITCSGKSLSALDSSLALSKCGVVSGSVVNVAGKLRGGKLGCLGRLGRLVQKFVDMENMSALKTGLGTWWKLGDPIWCIFDSGLNVRGTCRNSLCEAFDKRVICRKGFAVFNIAEVVHCPACKSAFTATTVSFNRCQWMFEGRKAGVHPIDMMSKWRMTSTKSLEYEYFDDEGGRNMVEWSRLVITAKLLLGDNVSKVMKNLEDCAICFGTLTIDSPIPNVDMACGHAAHTTCMTTFMQGCGYTFCPTCRDPITA